MSYYILPKKKKNIDCEVQYGITPCLTSISESLHYYIEDTEKQIQINIYEKEKERELEQETDVVLINKEYTMKYISSILNPYEFVFLKVPDSKYSVSKLKPSSNIFFIFMEILHTFRLLDSYQHKPMKTLHFGKEKNTESTIECLQILREEYADIHMSDCDTSLYIEKKNNIDILYFEVDKLSSTNVDVYIEKMITILCNILTFQAMNGTTIIKVDVLYHKPILDCLFILTTMFDKVYIIKPNISNILKSERYIVCKQMESIPNMQMLHDLRNSLIKTTDSNCECKFIHSIIPYSLPLYFVNKIEESNIMIGHQQLYVMDQLINIIKNKNIDDKLETLKKFHIQKCIQWCDKFKIPYNKCLEKVNIFLPTEEAVEELVAI